MATEINTSSPLLMFCSTPSTGARSAINLNTANDFWVVITATKVSAADTSGISDVQLTIDKP